MPYKNAEDKAKHHKGYWKQYYADPSHLKKHRAAVHLARKKREAKIRDFLAEYKLSRGCRVCGFKEHHAALDFAHRDRKTKLGTISHSDVLRWWSMERIQLEIEKCDVVCSNHHRIETYQEVQELKAS
jgi:hypothetical protein